MNPNYKKETFGTLSKCMKRRLRKKRRKHERLNQSHQEMPLPAPPAASVTVPPVSAPRAPPQDPGPPQKLQLSERQVGGLVGKVCESLGTEGLVQTPNFPVNNDASCWIDQASDSNYVLITNIPVDNCVRFDDRPKPEDLPTCATDYSSGPYALPVLRPKAGLPLPIMGGVVVHPNVHRASGRCYHFNVEDLPPRHRVEITGNVIAQVESVEAARDLLSGFILAALDSFGDEARATGRWSVYVGTHNDCAADNGHPDAFSRAFKMNGKSAEMTRTRSTIGYGPSAGPGRKAALLTLRNCPPGKGRFYQDLPARQAMHDEMVTGTPCDADDSALPIPSTKNKTGFEGVTVTKSGSFMAAIRLGVSTNKRCLGIYSTAEAAAISFAVARHQKEMAARLMAGR